MTAPEWISTELFQNALRQYFGNKNIQILGFTSSAAVPAGDNYTSDLFRTKITYRTGINGNHEIISVIVKCSPENRAQMLLLVREIKLFEKEAEMFQVTLPAIYKILGINISSKFGRSIVELEKEIIILGESGTLSAKCIYSTDKPYSVIIFEDLKPLGFKMHDRQQGFDLEHCLLIVEKMARLHAASVVLYEQNPSLLSNYNEGLYSDNEMISGWMKTGLESLIQSCSKWTGFEKYSTKLTQLRDQFISRGVATSKRKLGGFNVLNHGDSWVNNFMFSYTSDGKLKDFRFVDYQLVIFTSPAIDLHYFWTTSPTLEVRKEHLETILDRYYGELLANLAKLNYSLERVPTREQFRKDWNSRAFYGLIASATVLPLVKATSRDDASFEDLMENGNEDSFRYHAYNNEGYRKHMEYLLPFFDSLGILD